MRIPLIEKSEAVSAHTQVVLAFDFKRLCRRLVPFYALICAG
jgi:hypothetical protein